MAVFRELTANEAALGALVPGQVSPAGYATMRGILDTFGVRVVVWHADAPEAPPERHAVLPWDAALCMTVHTPSCGTAHSTTHEPDRLATLLLQLTRS